jgi:chromosome segregation ATPase
MTAWSSCCLRAIETTTTLACHHSAMAIAELQQTIRELRASLIEATDEAEEGQASLAAMEALCKDRKAEAEHLLRRLQERRAALMDAQSSMRETILERQTALEHANRVWATIHGIQADTLKMATDLQEATAGEEVALEYVSAVKALRALVADASAIR